MSTQKEYTVSIDGKDYVITKFKFGKQTELASLVASVLTGTDLDLTKVSGENVDIKIDIGTLLMRTPSLMPEIVSLATDIPIDKVKEIEDSDVCYKIIDHVWSLNDVPTLLGKSLGLLSGLMKV